MAFASGQSCSTIVQRRASSRPLSSPDNEQLLTGTGTAASPWVIAIENAGIKGLPSGKEVPFQLPLAWILTFLPRALQSYQRRRSYSCLLGRQRAFYALFSYLTTLPTLSAKLTRRTPPQSDLYASSRTLYGLALDKKAPAIFRKCTKGGVPIYALAVTSLFGFLAYSASPPPPPPPPPPTLSLCTTPADALVSQWTLAAFQPEPYLLGYIASVRPRPVYFAVRRLLTWPLRCHHWADRMGRNFAFIPPILLRYESTRD